MEKDALFTPSQKWNIQQKNKFACITNFHSTPANFSNHFGESII